LATPLDKVSAPMMEGLHKIQKPSQVIAASSENIHLKGFPQRENYSLEFE